MRKISSRRVQFSRFVRPTGTGSTVRSFYEDPSGYMLPGTSNGLLVRHIKSGQQEQYVHNPADPDSISADTVATI